MYIFGAKPSSNTNNANRICFKFNKIVSTLAYYNSIMKRSILLFLTFLYLTTASGINISLHYCGGKFKNISFFNACNNESCCCKKGKKKNCSAGKQCCRSKVIVVQVKDIHNYSPSSIVSGNPVKFISVTTPQYIVNFTNTLYTKLISDFHVPPDLYETPIYLKHRVLII